MKNKLFLISAAFICVLILLSTKKPQQGEVYEKALPKFKKNIVQDFDNLLIKSNILKNTVYEHQDSAAISQDEINAYYEVRKAFKTVEAILEYVDKQNHDRSLNGAPLPKLNPKDPDLVIVEPKGLQVMDEIMFDDGFNADKHKELYEFTEKFSHGLKKYMFIFSRINLSERQLFEAYRYNVIRIASLSITGFDTPGSLRGITDAKHELLALKKYIGFFNEELVFTQNQKYLEEFNFLTKRGVELLEAAQNFNDFNRLQFMREVINPLYKNLRDIHYMLEYETWNETDANINHHLDYNAEFLFSKDFLDKFSYVSFGEDSLFSRRARLGKILFYDPILSSNNQMACASCHDLNKAFTDGKAKSLASDGRSFLNRNSMTLPYSVYAEKMFWDMRAIGLENQFAHVVTSEKEFSTEYKEIIKKLKKSKTYKYMFELAFPGKKDTIITNDVDYALAAYVMTLGDFDSPFDEFMRYERFDLSEDAQKGFNLFAGKAACATCHFIPTFSGLVPPYYAESESEVLGITKSDIAPWVLDDDKGRAGAYIKEKTDFYQHSIKTVTVRNAEKTAPYMHNGAFTSLETLMDFYNDGGGAGRGLDVEHQTLSDAKLGLSQEEIQQIIAFVNSLTDQKVHTVPQDFELPRDFENPAWNERKIP